MANVMLCSKCLHVGESKRSSPGGLWLGFLLCGVGGLFFWPLWIGLLVIAIYEQVQTKRRCPQCQSDQLLPPDSVAARVLMAQAEQALARPATVPPRVG